MICSLRFLFARNQIWLCWWFYIKSLCYGIDLPLLENMYSFGNFGGLIIMRHSSAFHVSVRNQILLGRMILLLVLSHKSWASHAAVPVRLLLNLDDHMCLQYGLLLSLVAVVGTFSLIYLWFCEMWLLLFSRFFACSVLQWGYEFAEVGKGAMTLLQISDGLCWLCCCSNISGGLSPCCWWFWVASLCLFHFALHFAYFIDGCILLIQHPIQLIVWLDWALWIVN